MPGLYFEEFSAGQVFRHAIRRTVTEADNVFFSALTLGLVVGLSVGDTTLGTTVGNLGWDEVRFPKPVFHGDTIRVESEVLEARDSRSRPDNGIVIFAHRGFNQRNELVMTCKRSALMLRRPQA